MMNIEKKQKVCWGIFYLFFYSVFMFSYYIYFIGNYSLQFAEIVITSMLFHIGIRRGMVV